MTVKAILFDKDGTLIDFADTFFDACGKIIWQLAKGDKHKAQLLAAAASFDLSTNTCPANSQIIEGTSQTIAELWQPIVMHQNVATLADELDAYFNTYTQQSVTAFSFTQPTLEKLRQLGYTLGVATNDSEQNAHSHLENIGADRMFSFVVGYDSGFGAKPGAGMVEAFSRHCKISCSEIAMVGDSRNDLLAGKRAGATAIAVTSGIADDETLAPDAHYVLADISGLPELLKKLNAAAP